LLVVAELESLEPDLEVEDLPELPMLEMPTFIPEPLPIAPIMKSLGKKFCTLSPEAGVLFTSYNFPENYDPFTDCDYVMKAGPGKRVQLTFFIFDIESNPRCSYDRLTVYDSNGTSIHKFCGKNTKNVKVTSTEQELSFTFRTDGVQQRSGFLASWKEVETAENQKSEGSYLVSFPRSLIEDSKENICVELFGDDRKDVIIEAQVYVAGKEQEEKWIFGHSPIVSQSVNVKAEEKAKCFELTMPKVPADKGFFNIKIIGDPSNSVEAFKEVTILKKEDYPLIQTDKGQYKAKDDVKFRIMLVDHNLRPSEVKTVDELWVEDPRGRRIKQWKEQNLQKGLLQQQFKLSEEPELGLWTIHFKAMGVEHRATFTVSEYVLPKFEVTIKPPAAILRDTLTANWKVCAIYTHGGSVKGTVKANFTSTFRQRTWRPPIVKSIALLKKVTADEDCAVLTLAAEQIKDLTENVDKFDLKVDFEEEGTGKTENSKWSGQLVDEAIKLDFGSSSEHFIVGGFPYVAEFNVKNHDESPREDDIEICVRLFKDVNEIRNLFNQRGIWSMDEDEIVEIGQKMINVRYSSHCHQMRSYNGKIQFYVPMSDIPKDVTKLNIKATATNHLANDTSKMKQPIRKLDVSLTHTDSDFVINMKEKERSPLSCGEEFKAKIFFSSQLGTEFDFHYIALSKGHISKTGTMKISANQVNDETLFVGEAKKLTASKAEIPKIESKDVVTMTEIPIPINHMVSPSFELVIFVNQGNQTLTDSHTYKIEACQQHEVSSSWSEKKVNPGSPVTLSVNAESQSLCAISATDKSVELLGNENKITRASIGNLQEDIGRRKMRSRDNNWEIQRKCPETYNALKVYESTGIQLLTDLTIMNTCETITDAVSENEYELNIRHEVIALSMSAPKLHTHISKEIYSPEKPRVALRNYFPENWLFELVSVEEGKDGIQKDLTSPHTITTWEAEATCMSSQYGLGVSKPSSLLVSQDFFAEIRLPYSVKRDEIFSLNVSVFNYISVELPVKVTIITSEDEIRVDKENMELCIGPKDNKVLSLKSSALKLGEVDVKVEAKIDNAIKNCKSVEEGNGYADTLVKQLRVKPEGIPVEKVESDIKCFESGKETFKLSKLEVPDNAVSESERAWVYVTGDIMAPALENVGNLVRLPTGCGEQNMVGLVPNIYLLQYLDHTNQKEPEIEKKAKEYMEIGYNRQQKYRHPNGAYSIWGDRGDKDGSTWLTAFVVKSFSEASEYIDVDKQLVQNSVNWLLKGQMENGCFRKRGYVHSSYLKGGGSDDSLTPFVTTALLEARSRMGIKVEPHKLMESVDCMLKMVNTTDMYTTIVTAHTANLLESKIKNASRVDKTELRGIEMLESNKLKLETLMNEIVKQANTSEPGSKFWDNERNMNRWGYYYTTSDSVEMTAYNVMSYMLRDEVPEAIDSVKWLARQRNSQGGFISTQDTVVALQALSMYAQRVTRIPLDMTVDITERHEIVNKLNTFKMNEENSLLLQTQKLTKLPSKLELESSGSGCAMVQSVLRYNMPEVEENTGFSIKAQGINNSIGDPILVVCSVYTGYRDKTGMVLIEIEMVTGWEAVNPQNLKNMVDTGVQRVEEDEKENKVVLYFESMPKKTKCIDLEIKEVTIIENAKDALIMVYDYYNREESASTLYNLNY